jgi:hypothetical protein
MASEVPAGSEEISGQDLVEAYNAVFSVRGGATVAKRGPQVHYAEDLLRRMPELGAQAFRPLDLAEIRSLPKNQLMRLLFKAVAGHFIAGPSSLRGDVCRLEADPASGALELVRDGGTSQVALVVIALVLLCVLFVMLYKREQEREKTKAGKPE